LKQQPTSATATPPFTVSEALRAHIDVAEAGDGLLRVQGWVCHPSLPVDRIALGLDGQPWVSDVEPYDRPDVQRTYPTFPFASRVGFKVSAPLSSPPADLQKTTIGITPYSGGRPLDTVRAFHCAYAEERRSQPQPPVALQERIGGSTSYVETGVQAVMLIRTYVEKYKRLSEAARILDWGCGCGRLITQFRKFVPGERLFGCDIDSEAIAWAQQNIPGPSFYASGPYPPTRYPDDHFDMVYAVSVLTHLDEKTQLAWLGELARITRPGAILLLTVIGRDLRKTNMPAELAREFEEKGFAVTVPGYSKLLELFSHKDYYKEAFHSREYIATNWSRFFDVLEYVETGHQDLVVLRAR
jgi:SAM-dependent methyltransferase